MKKVGVGISGLCKPGPETFLDTSRSFGQSKHVLFGAPMDLTGTYRRGSRFAPGAIRRASRYMESYSVRLDLDGEDLLLCDLGDLQGSDETDEWLRRIETLAREVSESEKTAIMIGGEHTVTLGALRAFENAAVLDLDAHLDLRDEFLGTRLSHATFLRRTLEEKERPVVVLGARALSKEELSFAGKLKYITAGQMRKETSKETLQTILKFIPREMPVYLTIDMDALDPSEAPAVCNPAPEGLTLSQALDILQEVCLRRRILGIDLCEVTPYYDSGLTSVQAAKMLLEAILAVEKGGDSQNS